MKNINLILISHYQFIRVIEKERSELFERIKIKYFLSFLTVLWEKIFLYPEIVYCKMWPPAWVHATRPLGTLFVTRPLIGQYQVQSRPDDQWEVLYHSVCGGRSFPNTADAFSAGWVEEWKGCVDTGLCLSVPGQTNSTVIPNTASHLSVNTPGKKIKNNQHRNCRIQSQPRAYGSRRLCDWPNFGA